MKKILAALFLVCMAASFSATITWRKYREITSDVTVSSTDVLIIEAGTVLRFAPYVKLTVYGEIKAMGTEAEPVLFAALDRGDTQWGGITINSMSGVNEFNYSRFVFMNANAGSGNAGMNILGSNVTISNCFYRDNYGENGGALKIVGGNVTVTGTTFTYNGAPNGGGIYIYNDSPNGQSSVNINNSKFNHNDGWTAGGAIYVLDNENSVNNMQVNISNCLMSEHYSGTGGAFYYESRGKIDMTFKKAKIFGNSADFGSGIYMVFMPHAPGNVLAQRFSNLLIFKNGASVSAAAYVDMGLTQNPQNVVFTNMTIAYNNIEAVKSSQKNLPGGLHLKSTDGKFLKPANSILWGNTANMEPANFMIDDTTMPNPDQVFWYCDIEGWFSETNNISSPPLFIRRPADAYAEIITDPDKYDFHLRLNSPCIDAGDPAEPCFEPNSSRVNIGACGNTNEAAKGTSNEFPATANTDVVIADNTATILNFQGKSGTTTFLDLNLGVNSELYITKSENMDSIIFNNIFTPTGKFDDSFVRIHTLDANTPVQNLTVKGTANLNNADIFNLILTMRSETGSDLIVNNSRFYADSIPSDWTPYAIDLINPTTINITNSKFTDYYGGIRINPLPMDPGVNKQKASGRIANNTISFEPTPSSKAGGGYKLIGIEISNAIIDVEDNEIDGGDEGVVMKAGSSGRITNNTISFEPTPSSKGNYIKKAIVLSGGSSSSGISNNIIVNDDWDNTLDVIGIEIDNSVGVVSYNQLRYGSYDSGPRTGINLISPQTGTAVYNNTIFGTYTGIGNTTTTEKIDITNNIFWSWDSTSVQAVNDTINLRFYNNCFIKGLPVGITGEGNFNLDPQFNSDYTGDFTLASTSACINAGMIIDGVHSFASSKTVYYYGSAPDIGAEEFWQDSQPVNVSTSVSGTDFTFSWNSVPGFTYYKVYSSDDPFGSFTVAYHGTSLSYTASVSAKKFYYVVATTDAPTKIYDSRPALSESKTDAAPTPRERAKQFRIDRQQKNR